ncbi:MAG TPA: tetratricopeptide repeat protein [Spirochaetota bacterium]|nr:tetratricopeptide repeat protein [Spirochaetota bacterium]
MFKKIIYPFLYILVSIILFLIFINADSVTGASDESQTTTIAKKTNTKKENTSTTINVDSKTGASENKDYKDNSSTTSSTLSTSTTIKETDAVTGATDYKEISNETTTSTSSSTTTTSTTTTTITVSTIITSTTQITTTTSIANTTTSTTVVTTTTISQTTTVSSTTTTTINNILKVSPKIEEEYKTPLVRKKTILVNEDQTKIADTTKNDKKIETKDDFEFMSIDRNRKSDIIIFEDENSKILPTLNFMRKKELSNEEKTYYELPNFKPKNISEFYLAEPQIKYENSIIKNSEIFIGSDIGDKAFDRAYEMFKTNQIKNAKTFFEKLVYYNYKVKESIFYLSQCYFINRDYIKAITYLKHCIKLTESTDVNSYDIANYYFHIGITYYELKDFNNAIDNFNKSYEINNNLIKNLYHLGLSYYRLNNMDKTLYYWNLGAEKGNDECKLNLEWLKDK